MTTENASPDCLVVLGARITPDGRPGRIARLRVEHALKLWLERGATGCLILSGGCSREGLAVSEARAMADHALRSGAGAQGASNSGSAWQPAWSWRRPAAPPGRPPATPCP